MLLFEPVSPALFFGGKTMKIRSLLSGMIILACSLTPAFARDYEDAFPDRGRVSCRIVAVLDGDTADCVSENRSCRIRFANIDAPEKSQAFCWAAKKRLNSLIYGRDAEVLLECRDRYGRCLGVVYLDGENV